MPCTIVREGLRGGKSEGGAEEEMAKCTSLWLWWLMRRGGVMTKTEEAMAKLERVIGRKLQRNRKGVVVDNFQQLLRRRGGLLTSF